MIWSGSGRRRLKPCRGARDIWDVSAAGTAITPGSKNCRLLNHRQSSRRIRWKPDAITGLFPAQSVESFSSRSTANCFYGSPIPARWRTPNQVLSVSVSINPMSNTAISGFRVPVPLPGCRHTNNLARLQTGCPSQYPPEHPVCRKMNFKRKKAGETIRHTSLFHKSFFRLASCFYIIDGEYCIRSLPYFLSRPYIILNP